MQELAKLFAMPSLPAVSQHLKVSRPPLRRPRTFGAMRPCRSAPKALKEATEWPDQYRRFWEESFGKLDLYLKDIQGKGWFEVRRQL